VGDTVDQTTDQWWNDEELLLAALDRALRPNVDVPTSFGRTAESCFSWHSIDAELAALAYDSAADSTQETAVRAESASLRALTFEATEMTFELEVMPDGLAGQLVPPQAGELQMQLINGETIEVRADDNGYFRIRPLPRMPFRLRFRLRDGRVVSTDRISL